MPHLARPTLHLRRNRSVGMQRLVAEPERHAISLRLTDRTPIQKDPEALPQREDVSTNCISSWDQESMRRRVIDPSAHADGTDVMTPQSFTAATAFLLTPDFCLLSSALFAA